jgi:hypothetical protein
MLTALRELEHRKARYALMHDVYRGGTGIRVDNRSRLTSKKQPSLAKGGRLQRNALAIFSANTVYCA